MLLVIQRLLHMKIPERSRSVSACFSKYVPDLEVERTVDSVLLCSEDGGKMLSHTGCPCPLALAAPVFCSQICMLRCRDLGRRTVSWGRSLAISAPGESDDLGMEQSRRETESTPGFKGLIVSETATHHDMTLTKQTFTSCSALPRLQGSIQSCTVTPA